MSVVTKDEVKTYLQISSTDYDSLIDTYIPIVQEDLCEITNNDFLLRDVWNVGTDFVFAHSSSSADTITDGSSDFTGNSRPDFKSNFDIVVHGSGYNDGKYQLDNVTASVLTLTTTEELVAEDDDEAVTISQVKWPKPVKPVAAQMIWHRIKGITQGGVQSESLGDYSVTYDKTGYPQNIIESLRPYMKVRTR
jgi:hypothetical protein